MSEKVAASSRALHVAEQVKLDGSVDRLGHGAHGARQLAKVTVAVAGLNGLHGGAQGRLVFDGLGHEPQLRSERRYLTARGAFSGKHAHGCVLGIGEPGSGAHAEGVVDHQQHQTVARKRGRVAVDEGIGESENQQHQHQQPQRQQQEIVEPAMTGGADDARLVEHQRRHGFGRALMPLQQMQVERKREPGEAGQEPGREESHLNEDSHLLAASAWGGDGGIEEALVHEEL